MATIYDILKELNIPYQEAEHKAVFTIEEAEAVRKNLPIQGDGCKNLFLRDKKKNYYLLILPHEKRANLKEVAHTLGLKHLSFASEEELQTILGLTRGSVSPFGLINDKEHQVTVLLDESLRGKHLLFHPNTNTRSLSLTFNDFLRYLDWTTNSIRYIN